MKVLLEFGATIKKDVVWHKEIAEFPKVVTYKLSTWEFVMWDKDHSGIYEFRFYFKELKNYAPGQNMYGLELPTPDIDEMFGKRYSSDKKCECGARYDRDFPNIHSFWCDLYGRE